MNNQIEGDEERHNLPYFKEQFSGNKNSTAKIGIKISSKCANTREGQLLLWMTGNLVARLKGLITRIEFVIPKNIALTEPSFIPFGELITNNLRNTILEATEICARDCEIIASKSSDFGLENDAIILIGSDSNTKSKCDFVRKATCDDWLAFVGKEHNFTNIASKNSNNPFGAFSAACIVVGEIFKFLNGMNENYGSYASNLCFSSYDCNTIELSGNYKLTLANPAKPDVIDLKTMHIVGSGAVAHSFCHTLYALEGITGKMVFIDRNKNQNGIEESLESTNLARYVMATNPELDEPKAKLLADKMKLKKGISVSSHDYSFETFESDENFHHIISCVDNNHARHSIQDKLPLIIHGGSTNGMRVQISVYDLLNKTQCLKCYNPKESYDDDTEIISRLSSLTEDERIQEA